jgi:hypothetical protein
MTITVSELESIIAQAAAGVAAVRPSVSREATVWRNAR